MVKGRINHPNDYVRTDDGRKWAFDFEHKRWVSNNQVNPAKPFEQLLNDMIAMRANADLADMEESSTWTYDCEKKQWLLNEPQVLDTGGGETIKGLVANFESKVRIPAELESYKYYELYIPGEQVVNTEVQNAQWQSVQDSIDYLMHLKETEDPGTLALAELWEQRKQREKEELQIELLRKQNAAIDLLTLAAGFYVGRKIAQFGNSKG